MKYLIFTLFFIVNCSILVAQDTIYVKGKTEPVLAEIKIVKKKSINYLVYGREGLRTISLKKVKRIAYKDKTKSQFQGEEIIVEKGEEYLSTISVGLSGVLSQRQAGVNYMHRLSSARTKRITYWGEIGGGYHALITTRRSNEGFYIEFGAQAEIASKKDPKNRFHIGLYANHQWAYGREFNSFSLFSSGGGAELESGNYITFQVPIGYTYRGEKGLFVMSGLEITPQLIFPALHFKVGWAFGK